ncbi:MAG: hypothetical protein ABGZ23_27700 [Fuerstiella sp.]
MLEVQNPKYTASGMALLCLVTVTASGCISSLPGARSSLTPRTAAVDRDDVSTVRSQSDKLSGNWTVPVLSRNIGGGHSGIPSSAVALDTRAASADTARVPTARLLTPQFNARKANQDPTVRPAGSAGVVAKIVPMRQKVVAKSPAPRPALNLVGGHSSKSSANQIRAIINQRSDNEMSRGDLLTERDAKWQVLPQSEQLATAENELRTGESGPDAVSELGSPAVVVRTATFHGLTPTIAETGDINNPGDQVNSETTDTETDAATEPSVFDRLRGLYDTSAESGPREIFKRQFQRLQPSWSPFRERDEQPVQLPPEEQAVDVTVDAAETPSAASPLLLQLIAETTAELNNWPGLENGTPQNVDQFRRRHQDLRLLQLVANQPGEAIAAIETMPPAEQDFWQELMLGLAQYRSVPEEADREVALTNAAGQLTFAVRRLAPVAALRCRRLDICSRIFSYGRIETFPSNDFEPGQPILLYAELENFTTEPTSTGSRRTSFDAQLQILHEDESADPIETINLSNITDESSSERSDYYQSFELTVPSHLARGTYRIRIRLRDRISGKATQEVVSFQVR